MQSSALQPILGGNLDLQPATPMSVGVVRHDLSAMELHDVRDVTLTGLEVHWEGSFPEFYRNAIHAESFDGLTIDGFKGEGSVPSYAALSFQQGKNLSVHNAQAFTGALWDSKGMKSSTTSMPKP
jgi:hypothetical protein